MPPVGYVDIPGFEGEYAVDKHGEVWVYPKKVVVTRQGGKRSKFKNDNGYYTVRLTKNGKSRGYLVHRLVGMAFLDNPENKPQINHKNSIRDDNRVENLEWCTHSENMIHKYASGFVVTEEMKRKLREANAVNSKKIRQLKDGVEVAIHSSISQAGRATGCSAVRISECASGKRKHHRGFTWEYIK